MDENDRRDGLLATLRADLNATRKYTGGWGRSIYPSFFCVALYRLTQALRRTPLKPLGWVLFCVNHIFTGAEIPPSVDFGPGLYVVHPGGLTVSPGSRGGRGVVLFGGVVIGSASPGHGVEGRYGDPTLGDEVTVLAKASVVGPISVGDGSTIGAHSLVLSDIPPRAIAAGVPARVLRTY